MRKYINSMLLFLSITMPTTLIILVLSWFNEPVNVFYQHIGKYLLPANIVIIISLYVVMILNEREQEDNESNK